MVLDVANSMLDCTTVLILTILLNIYITPFLMAPGSLEVTDKTLLFKSSRIKLEIPNSGERHHHQYSISHSESWQIIWSAATPEDF